VEIVTDRRGAVELAGQAHGGADLGGVGPVGPDGHVDVGLAVHGFVGVVDQ
jgi:hypothetical protein